MLQGLAFGLLFLNSSAAIVSYFVLPSALNIIGTLWDVHAPGAALDRPVGRAGRRCSAAAGTSPASSGPRAPPAPLIWVVLPLVVGLVRVLRAEVK